MTPVASVPGTCRPVLLSELFCLAKQKRRLCSKWQKAKGETSVTRAQSTVTKVELQNISNAI